jgi:uncharacterized membrane protein YgcG
MGPAAIRYVWKQKFDDKGFAASLVDLAVKGRARIVEYGKGFSIERKEDTSQPLARGENELYRVMPTGMTALENHNYAKVNAMKDALQGALRRDHEGITFLRNLRFLAGGVVLSMAVLAVGGALLPSDDAGTGLLLAVWCGVWLILFLAFGWALVKGLFSSRGLGKRIGSIFSLAFIAPFFIGAAVAPAIFLYSRGSAGLDVFAVGAILLVIMAFVFHKLLRAPTIMGRQLLDQIEGFRLYMTTAEEERLKVLHPPEKTPELFERYLPYALALDCENEWNAKFAAVLAAAAAAAVAGAGIATSPGWYSGRNWDPRDMGSFTHSIGSSLATSTSSASVPPGTSPGSGGSSSSSGDFSSGGSGGGSSGGGGGGGGGSGW